MKRLTLLALAGALAIAQTPVAPLSDSFRLVEVASVADAMEQLYQQRLGGTSGFSSSPVAAGGRLYITNEDGVTQVIALGREYKPLARNELGESVMASPAISGDVLYLRGRNHLFAIGAR